MTCYSNPALDRGQLRPEGVRRLIDETLNGRAKHTRALGVLVTFELFQRQFVDGDGYQPDAPAETPAEVDPAASPIPG